MTPPPRSHLPVTLALAMGALLFGLVIGNFSNKADLRHAREEVDKFRKDLATRGSSPASINGITSILNLPDARKSGTARRGASPSPPLEVKFQSPTVSTQDLSAAAADTGQTQRAGVSLRRQLESASGLWKTRSELARNSFLSNVSTDDEHATQFDVIMAAMNLRLSNDVSQSVAAIRTNQTLSAEDGLRILHSLSGDIVQAYQDLDASMPEGWRGKAGSKFAVFDFINPEAVLPLAELDEAQQKRIGRHAPHGAGDETP